MQVILAKPRGFCAGVVRAIEIVDRALVKYGAPVHVRHEIVHNKHVVEGLRNRGARFVESLESVPGGAVAVFSAHGVASEVEDEARARQLAVIDATCPLVSKVHIEANRHFSEGREIGAESGVPSYLIADGSELDPAWLEQAELIGITAGASAPEAMVQDVLAALRRLGPVDVSTMDGIEENAVFRLPAELADPPPKPS
jgi:4-hydroxy-3-methylbut-2-enyl diphosphate reductase IspH